MLPDIIDVVRPSVVQITFTVLDLTDQQKRDMGITFFSEPIGTGFLVNEDAVVATANHVVDAVATYRNIFQQNQVHVGIGLAYPNDETVRGNFNVSTFDVVATDPVHDVALVKSRANPWAGEIGTGILVGNTPIQPLYGTARLRVDRPRDGSGIASSGYPLAASTLVTTYGIVASSWSVEVDDVPDPNFPGQTIPELRDVYLADLTANGGNSGGPVYSTDDGSVIGVLVAGKLAPVEGGDHIANIAGVRLLYSAGLTIVAPVKYVTDLLDANGIPWASPDAPTA